MRHESRIGEPYKLYLRNLVGYAFRAENEAFENEQWTIVNRMKDVATACLLILELKILLSDSTQTLEAAAEAWLPIPEGSNPSTVLWGRLVEAGVPNGDVDYYVKVLQKSALHNYGSNYDELPTPIRLRLIIERFLGLTPQDFQTKNLQELIEKSVIGELAKKLIEGQGDYSFLL